MKRVEVIKMRSEPVPPIRDDFEQFLLRDRLFSGRDSSSVADRICLFGNEDYLSGATVTEHGLPLVAVTAIELAPHVRGDLKRAGSVWKPRLATLVQVQLAGVLASLGNVHVRSLEAVGTVADLVIDLDGLVCLGCLFHCFHLFWFPKTLPILSQFLRVVKNIFLDVIFQRLIPPIWSKLQSIFCSTVFEHSRRRWR